MTIHLCFGPGTGALAEVVEDTGITRDAWESMTETERDAMVQDWIPARSGVSWVEVRP